MKKIGLILVLMLTFILALYAGVGYVDINNRYSNAWTTSVTAGQTIFDITLPKAILIDTIVVGGDSQGIVAIYINGYDVRRYSHKEYRSYGEELYRPIYVAAGVHIKAIFETGTSGVQTISISGQLQ